MKLPPSPPQQGELLNRHADTTFTHLFSALFISGDAKRMGEVAFMVFCCIKTYASIDTGISFPSMDTVAEHIGKSRDTVQRAINKLTDMGYVEVCGKRGRNNVYRCRERFPIMNNEGEIVESAIYSYIPKAVREVQRQVKQYVEQGRVEGHRVIHIEKIEVNINYGTQIGTLVTENVNLNGVEDRDMLFDRMNSAKEAREAREAEFRKIREIFPDLKSRDDG